jgi:hypothetical protein
MQTAVGLVCVVIGTMHFVDRGRTPHTRSFYLGSVTQSHRLRAALALIEVSCGFLLLFTA